MSANGSLTKFERPKSFNFENENSLWEGSQIFLYKEKISFYIMPSVVDTVSRAIYQYPFGMTWYEVRLI